MKMGLCSVVTSDQGKEFNNRLNQELMKLLGIDHRLTTPYHPQVSTIPVFFVCGVCVCVCFGGRRVLGW